MQQNNQNPTQLYFLDNDYAYNDNSIKTANRSKISILIYFLLFFVISSFIVLGIQLIYIFGKGYDLTIINPESPFYNEQFTNEMSFFTGSLGNLVIYLLGLIVIYIIMGYSLMNDFRKLRWEKPITFIKYLGVGFIFYYIANFIAGAISMFLPTEAGNEQGIVEILTSNTLNLALMSVTTIIFAPILEEIIFRKCFFNLLSRKFNTVMTVLLSGVLFGAIHIINPTIEAFSVALQDPTKWLNVLIQFAYLFVYSIMGVGLSLTYQFSKRNLVPVILIHMINNFISVMSTIVLAEYM